MDYVLQYMGDQLNKFSEGTIGQMEQGTISDASAAQMSKAAKEIPEYLEHMTHGMHHLAISDKLMSNFEYVLSRVLIH